MKRHNFWLDILVAQSICFKSTGVDRIQSLSVAICFVKKQIRKNLWNSIMWAFGWKQPQERYNYPHFRYESLRIINSKNWTQLSLPPTSMIRPLSEHENNRPGRSNTIGCTHIVTGRTSIVDVGPDVVDVVLAKLKEKVAKNRQCVVTGLNSGHYVPSSSRKFCSK